MSNNFYMSVKKFFQDVQKPPSGKNFPLGGFSKTVI